MKHLKAYLISIADRLKGKEIFILRNLSQRGIGFFVESASFYPDFILWVIEEKEQNIYFLDPKGIRMLGNFQDNKIHFCAQTIQEINEAVNKQLSREKSDYNLSFAF